MKPDGFKESLYPSLVSLDGRLGGPSGSGRKIKVMSYPPSIGLTTTNLGGL